MEKVDVHGYDPALAETSATMHSSWEGMGWWSNKWDIINLSFVLEHVLNPLEILDQCKGRLATGGVVIVESPWDFSPLQQGIRKGGEQAWWVSSPDHVNYFTKQSAMKLMGRVGVGDFITPFNGDVRASSTYPVELFIASGLDYRVNEKARQAIRDHRKNLQVLWRESGMSKTGVGRTFWLVGGVA